MKKILISAYACIPNLGSEEGNGWNYASIVSQQSYQKYYYPLLEQAVRLAFTTNLLLD